MMKLAWMAEETPAETEADSTTPARVSSSGLFPTSPEHDRDEGLRRLYEDRHADMVRFAAFLTGDANAAEDIAQEAFVKVFDAWERIADIDRVEAYLKSTVVNLVRGRHRRRQVAERRDHVHLTVVRSAEDDAIDSFGRERTMNAVAALPLRQRACVVMRHWMRMTESEIAETLELSVGSVRTHIKRGIESLKISLGEQS
jgi:RNA polymerase sigma-70 factor (sigma-E family)